MKVFEEPVYVYMDSGTFTVGVEFATYPLPDRDELVEIKLFGGKTRMLVNRAEWGTLPETENVMFINGRRVKV